MKGLFNKVIGVIAGMIAVLGISANNATASFPDIHSKSALYLEHGKQINNLVGTESWHTSHGSHGSHGSHESHQSHQSHSSGY